MTINASAAAKLDAWIDFNQDGDWSDSGEQIFTNNSVSSGSHAYPFTIPAGAYDGTTFSRFRLSTAGGLSPTGLADDGEVEDHEVTLVPELTITDVTLAEGNATGTTDFVFTVTRSQNHEAISVDFATRNGTAIAPSDYTAGSGTLGAAHGFSAGGSLTATISVSDNRDDTVELDEDFFVDLSNAMGAHISDTEGKGTIVNDDAATFAIDNVSQSEGDSGATTFTFTVTLTGVVSEEITVQAATADGTATTPPAPRTTKTA